MHAGLEASQTQGMHAAGNVLLGVSRAAPLILGAALALLAITVQRLFSHPKHALQGPNGVPREAHRSRTAPHVEWAHLGIIQVLWSALAAKRATAANKERILRQTAAGPLLLYREKSLPKS